jgi:DNA repair protein RadC
LRAYFGLFERFAKLTFSKLFPWMLKPVSANLRQYKSSTAMSFDLNSLPIRQWAAEERPREKMMTRGIGALSDCELLATILATGTRKHSAIGLARELIDHFGSLAGLSRADFKELTQVAGIGQAKATSIMSAFELAKRRSLDEDRRPIFTCSNDIYNYVSPKIGDLPHEVFYVLFLNRRNQLVIEKEMYRGSNTSVTVDGAYIFGKAISYKATGIILCHNHPSGNKKPSKSDDKLTQQIVSLGGVLQVDVLDHVIVTLQGWYSYADQGVIDMMKVRSRSCIETLFQID